jgi:hypothetical protein
MIDKTNYGSFPRTMSSCKYYDKLIQYKHDIKVGQHNFVLFKLIGSKELKKGSYKVFALEMMREDLYNFLLNETHDRLATIFNEKYNTMELLEDLEITTVDSSAFFLEYLIPPQVKKDWFRYQYTESTVDDLHHDVDSVILWKYDEITKVMAALERELRSTYEL